MGGETSYCTERKGGPQLLNISNIYAPLKSFKIMCNSSSEAYFGTEEEGTVGK